MMARHFPLSLHHGRALQSALLAVLCVAAVLLWTAPQAAAQTIIDMNTGQVRPKTADDYSQERGIKERQRADSLAYIDHVRRALNAMAADSLQEAESRLHQALKLRPDAPGNYLLKHHLGDIALAHNDWRQAVTLYTDVLAGHHDYLPSRYHRAVCYYELGSLTAAAEDCAAILRLNPSAEERTRLLFLRAAIQAKGHHPDLAMEDIETILREDPENTAAALMKARLLDDMGQRQAALDLLTTFVAAHPEMAEGFTARAQLLDAMGRTEAAIDDYAAALRLTPDDAYLYRDRAALYLKMGQKAAARRDLDAAVKYGMPRAALHDMYRQTQR